MWFYGLKCKRRERPQRGKGIIAGLRRERRRIENKLECMISWPGGSETQARQNGALWKRLLDKGVSDEIYDQDSSRQKKPPPPFIGNIVPQPKKASI